MLVYFPTDAGGMKEGCARKLKGAFPRGGVIVVFLFYRRRRHSFSGGPDGGRQRLKKTRASLIYRFVFRSADKGNKRNSYAGGELGSESPRRIKLKTDQSERK